MAYGRSMRGQTIEMLFLPVFIPVLTKENINVSLAKLISLVRPQGTEKYLAKIYHIRYIITMNFEVELLEPAMTFIHSLSQKMQNKALRAVGLLERFGYQLHEPESKTLTNADGLKELRVQFGGDICRLFYFHYMGKMYVVTSGYIKKEQKTKRSEIERALQIKKQFILERGKP
jgi:phage-related protein